MSAGGDEETALVPGERFGSYVIHRSLGRGAFGAVYEAHRLPLNKRVALKILHERMAGRGEAVARFIREAELVASFEHPHIVGVFDVGAHEGVPFLAMEFLEGETIEAKIVREGAQTLSSVLTWALPIMSALAAVHDRGVVHRDLKPENLFLARLSTGEVQPKLLDFGIAKVRESAQALTRTNALMGTPQYMSPEQAQESKHIDARSDQWSFAVILYRCLAGRSPFRGETLLELLTAIATAPIAPVSSVAAGVPEGVDRVLGRAMERDPARRFPSVTDLARALLPYADAPTQARWSAHFRYDDPQQRSSSARSSVTPTVELGNGGAWAPSLPPRTMVTPAVATGTVPLGLGPLGTLMPGGGTLQPHAHTLEPEARRPRWGARAGAAVVLVVLMVTAGVFVKAGPSTRRERPLAAPAVVTTVRADASSGVLRPTVPSVTVATTAARPSPTQPTIAAPPAVARAAATEETPGTRRHRHPPRRPRNPRPAVEPVPMGTIGPPPTTPSPRRGANDITNT